MLRTKNYPTLTESTFVMKKIYIFISLFFYTFTIVGCAVQSAPEKAGLEQIPEEGESGASALDSMKTESNDTSHLNSDTSKETEPAEDEGDTTDYESYTGAWSAGGLNHETILAQGGTELICHIEQKNIFSGSMYTQQGITERFASLDNISGIIENGMLQFPFSDDGWGGSGILCIRFTEDQITVDVSEYQMADTNLIGYGISGSYELVQVDDAYFTAASGESYDTGQGTVEENQQGVSYEQCLEAFYERHYAGMTGEQIEALALERSKYYVASKYCADMTDYWEHVRAVGDIANRTDPLFFTDMMYYTREDFEGLSAAVIHLAKNEIYAKRGYIFSDVDLNQYFMGCAWYQPIYPADTFDDSVWNDYERKNLELLSELDD